MSSKVVNIQGIGDILMTPRHNSGRLSLRVKQNGTICVNYPIQVSVKDVVNFIHSNVEWIEKQKEKQLKNFTVYKIGDIFQTKFHIIEIVSSPKQNGYANISNGKAIICLPTNREVESNAVQDFIRKVIAEVLRREARTYLPQRLEELSVSHGFKYNMLFVKKLKSKWGSCSNLGNINLSIYLMKLPNHLIDFIILHELAHTKEPNHGPKFHRLLNSLTNGKEADYNKELRKYSHLIER